MSRRVSRAVPSETDGRGPRILTPLRQRDYRRLATGSLVSLFGDGIFLVALPLQVYAVSNVPAAMAVVGAVWTASQVGTLLLGGWAGDRFERRRIMLAADVARALALGTVGVLSLSGELALWHVCVLGAAVGVANAFFNPAATSIVPDLLPEHELARANAFLGVARPAMVRLLGPAAGGLLVGAVGPGPAFLLDAATFLFSAVLVGGITRRPRPAEEVAPGFANSLRAVGEGFAFVRGHRWCWTWLAAAAIGLLAFTGPVDMLLPYVVKNDLGLTQRQAAYFLGAVLSAGGVGAVAMALLVGHRGLPRRRALTLMYLAQAAGVGALAVYGTMRHLWQGVLAALALNALFAFNDIAWTTTLQRQVPRRLLGRVSSLDWMTSLGAMPLSFLLAGASAVAVGARQVLTLSAALGAVAVLALMAVPGSRRLPAPPVPPAVPDVAVDAAS